MLQTEGICPKVFAKPHHPLPSMEQSCLWKVAALPKAVLHSSLLHLEMAMSLVLSQGVMGSQETGVFPFSLPPSPGAFQSPKRKRSQRQNLWPQSHSKNKAARQLGTRSLNWREKKARSERYGLRSRHHSTLHLSLKGAETSRDP